MGAFLKGIFMGLAITISLGPGFMALFQTSILRGVKAGIVLAVGIFISDLILIIVSYLGLAQIVHKNNAVIMGIIAGIILIVTGGVSFFRKSLVNSDDLNRLPEIKNSLPSLLLKGFLLNIANPFCLMFWVGIMGFAASNYGMNNFNFFIFFIGLLLTAFTSDLLKCYLSGALRKLFTSKGIGFLNKAIGITLILIGFAIIFKVI
jgi:threonine/homoserine/homoserine lactone efflux protein